MASSFPFFNIAREFGVDYGLVLAYAEVQEPLVTFDEPTLLASSFRAYELLSPECKTAVQAAVWDEHQRRGKVKIEALRAEVAKGKAKLDAIARGEVIAFPIQDVPADWKPTELPRISWKGSNDDA